MNIEQLSKSQIVLLTLLVSFVTSIATGIVTVSLMDQAPPAIAQTVNRIIERTVEKVTPAAQTAATASTVVTQEKTIIVKETDLISQAVARVNPSIVRLYSSSADSPVFLGLGVVIDASGTIVSDTEAIGLEYSAVAELANGSRVRASVTSRDAGAAIAYLSAATSTTDGKAVTWMPVAIAGSHPSLGEMVVMIAGKSTARIASGIITTFVPAAGESAPQVIETDISAAPILAGSPLITTDGILIGISTSAARDISASGFISSSVLMKQADKATKTASTTPAK